MSEKTPSVIEQNGLNPVPDAERYGRPFDLFPVWFSWNISIFGISLGVYVFSLGLSVWQAMAAGVLGYIISASFVGILSIGSVRTGLPTLAQSQMCFGVIGNRVPSLFGFIANLGWMIILLSLASTTLADLIMHLAGGSADKPSQGTLFASFAVVMALTLVGAIFGHSMIMKIERWIALITGTMTVIYLIFFVQEIDFSQLNSAPSGSFVTFVGGVILAMTMVGLGFLNYGGDYSRYLPRNSSAGRVIFWTTAGIAVPVSVLLILGIMLSVGNPEMLERSATEPLAALTGILPFWFYVPFSLVVITSLVSAGMTDVYSAGLAVMAVGLKLPRVVSTLISAALVALGCFYLTFISDSFLATFTSFLAAISVIMGSWGAIEMVDTLRQRALKWDVTLALPAAQGGSDLRWSAMASLIIASVIGLGTITSTDPYIAKITSFLLSEEAKQSTLAQANVGLIAAMVSGAAIYAVLTFVFKCGYKKA